MAAGTSRVNHSPQESEAFASKASAHTERLDLAQVRGYSEASQNLELAFLRRPSEMILGSVAVGQDTEGERAGTSSRVYFLSCRNCSSLAHVGLLDHLSQAMGSCQLDSDEQRLHTVPQPCSSPSLERPHDTGMLPTGATQKCYPSSMISRSRKARQKKRRSNMDAEGSSQAKQPDLVCLLCLF